MLGASAFDAEERDGDGEGDEETDGEGEGAVAVGVGVGRLMKVQVPMLMRSGVWFIMMMGLRGLVNGEEVFGEATAEGVVGGTGALDDAANDAGDGVGGAVAQEDYLLAYVEGGDGES